MPTEPVEAFHRTHRRLVDRLHGKARAERWRLSPLRLAEALHRSVGHRFRDTDPTPGDVTAYLESLQVDDLALACACASGDEAAWEHFVAEFRPILYAAARAIAGESAARELADSMYAELYGLEERGGQRRSLFEYFHGRSKLSTWLRAVLSQRHVDAVRAARRTEPLDERDVAEMAHRTAGGPEPDPERSRYLTLLHVALADALAALELRDHARLSYYYVQELTLAEIGRLMGEHEATSSRKLDRTRRELRTRVERTLAEKQRLSEAQIRLCYDYAIEEWPFDLTGALSPRE